MWSAHTETLSNGRILKSRITQNGSPRPFEEVLRGWQTDKEFRSFFTGLLSTTPFADFRWEIPPVTEASIGRPFEFVFAGRSRIGLHSRCRSVLGALW
jgi:hypothetical protein